MSLHSSRGDTIIEVLFAVTIFSLLAVLSLSIMNKGVAIAQRSLEVTLVRQQMDSQAELIRLAHAAYVKNADTTESPGQVWKDIKTRAQPSGSLPNIDNPTVCPSPVPGPTPFVVTRSAPASATLQLQTFSELAEPAVYSKVDVNRDTPATPAQGLWVQAVRVQADSASVGVDAYDVYIRACWASVGSTRPVTLGTIVRLYEPQN